MKYRHVGILSVGHLATDINQGALPAMLPFFIAAYDLSYAAAAGFVFAANMASSIVQPLFGHAADRFSKPWLLSVGLMLAGMGLALSGIFQGYRWIMLLAVVSGIGIAAYHPEAARLVNFAAGTRKGAAMSLFGVGGTIGFAIGPIIITTALLQWGMKGTLVLIVPVTIMSLVMINQFSMFKSLEANRNRERGVFDTEASKENWGAFARLTITVIGRSILFYGLNTFIPIYWIDGLNQSKAAGAMALTVFAGSGILGNLMGGSLADRLGQKKVMLLGFFGLTLFLPLLIFVNNVQTATLLLIPIGLMLYATYSPTIVLGQNYLPNRVGLSSGVTLGVAVAIGGGAALIIGRIADLYGIWFALASIAFLPIFTSAIALSLPGSQRVDAKSAMKRP
ncbi:MAG: MFS transporter, FSR family, fosmidomycin resistance protein [Desulfobacteraceae bacterium Eth-SRB2]|nr:MAG: MFS transporter, FSR family, fosmidomycin resistance protein [Desulfobacteraceae bacterium Eth-SRB2]